MSRVGRGLARLVLLGAAALSVGQGAGQTPHPGAGGATRERAMRELRARVSDPDRLQHGVAVEAIMQELAGAAGGDRTEWGLAGLLHDIDLADTRADPSQHGVVGARLLAELGFSEAVVRAVETHDDAAGRPRATPIAQALYCADRAYWAVRSSGLRFPSPEASSATPASVIEGLERRGATDRIDVKLLEACGSLGLTLEDVLRLCLQALLKHQ
jgi:putative nucleotidyltransferase with HDIG domain